MWKKGLVQGQRGWGKCFSPVYTRWSLQRCPSSGSGLKIFSIYLYFPASVAGGWSLLAHPGARVLLFHPGVFRTPPALFCVEWLSGGRISAAFWAPISLSLEPGTFPPTLTWRGEMLPGEAIQQFSVTPALGPDAVPRWPREPALVPRTKPNLLARFGEASALGKACPSTSRALRSAPARTPA